MGGLEENRSRSIVEAIIINKKNEVLLQKKTVDYESYPGGYWCFFGGGVEEDERPEDALKREIQEELNFNIVEFSLHKKHDFIERGNQIKTHIFLIPFNLNLSDLCLSEGGGFAFFSKEELISTKLIEHTKDILEEFFKINLNPS